MPTFTYDPDYVITETPQFNTLVSQFEKPLVEQRRNVGSLPQRRWRLRFLNRTQAQYEAIRDFFIARLGRYESFDWTNPNDSQSYTVRFDRDSVDIERRKGTLYDFETEFVEVQS